MAGIDKVARKLVAACSAGTRWTTETVVEPKYFHSQLS
jgi:hypothetical protein